MRPFHHLCVLGLLVTLCRPSIAGAQEGGPATLPDSSIGYLSRRAGEDPEIAQQEEALRRARRKLRGWTAGLVLSLGVMSAGAALIPKGVHETFSPEQPEQHRGNALMAGGTTMVVFGFAGLLGSAFALSAANKEKRRLETSLRR